MAPANSRDLAITPDGRHVVYVSARSQGAQLFVRRLDALDVAPLGPAGTARNNLFVSPDGQWVAFTADGGQLMKQPLSGGPPLSITTLNGPGRGGTWLDDGTIVFATADPTTGLWRVGANGGGAVAITKPDAERQGGDHYWPHALPGSRGVLFTVSAPDGTQSIAVLDLRTGQHRVLAQGSDAQYVGSGHIVYSVSGTLHASAFDLDSLEISGAPIPLLTNVGASALGAAQFDIAGNGTLVYFSGSTTRAGRSLVWVDRNGREVAIDAPPHEYQYPRVSPDGRRVAVDAFDQEQDVWMWELSRGAMLRFTSDLVRDTYPVWTPDGSRIIYGSFRTATASLFARRADGSGAEERLTESKATQYPQSISPDGSRLVFREDGPTQDLMMLALDGSRRIEPIVQTRFNERNGEVSPNGRWIAYESDETGTVEVYVRRFPDASSGVWGVSSGGGTRPLWSRDGSELFYISPANVLMRVRVTAGEAWGADAPVRLFEARYFFGQGTGAVGRTYDMSSDARQFLMIKESSASDADTPEGIVVVQSWLDELKRRVPAN